jgi:hypothetical protein
MISVTVTSQNSIGIIQSKTNSNLKHLLDQLHPYRNQLHFILFFDAFLFRYFFVEM